MDPPAERGYGRAMARGASKAHGGAKRDAGREPPVTPPELAVDGAHPDVYCRVDIPAAGFEGPLDLLLHLIQQHELDILDIPVGFVTERFLAYLALMENLAIDVASEYLVMAATLAHIKSKMLLPTPPAGQESDDLEELEDPRAELVRRLLEYQKYKAAAAEIAGRDQLGRDVFVRGCDIPVPEGPAPFSPVAMFSLLEAFERVLKRTKAKLEHEISFDRITITDRIVELTELFVGRERMSFEELLLGEGPEPRSVARFDLVITFLALLEMCRLRLVRVTQSRVLGNIQIERRLEQALPDDLGVDGELGALGVEPVPVEPEPERERCPPMEPLADEGDEPEDEDEDEDDYEDEA